MPSPDKIMTDSTPIPSIDILAQRSTGLQHTEATPSRPLDPVHCTCIKRAVLKRSSSDVPGLAMLVCKTGEELELVKFKCSLETSKEDKKTHPKEHTPYKSQQRTSKDPSRADTQNAPH